ncbi:MAG TPA: hypothetical protein VFC78_16895 [Tepidisphaeraceae bacterium]|nr:hypothetical protein [Tepidisphaeraceae bacterium]
MAEADLYTVRTSHGTVYAIVDPTSGAVWTERTEAAALRLAEERGIPVGFKGEIAHSDLLRLMGHAEPEPYRPAAQAPRPPVQPHPDPSAVPAKVAPPVDDGVVEVMYLPDARPLSAAPVLRARYHWEDEPDDEIDALILPKGHSPAVPNVFCSERQVAADAALPEPVTQPPAGDNAAAPRVPGRE